MPCPAHNDGRIAAIDTPENLRAAINSRQYVEVRFSDGQPANSDLEALAGVLQVESDNRIFKLYTKTPGQTATGIVRLTDKRGLNIMDLCIRKPSLEDVYLHFTKERTEGDAQ